MLSSTGKPLMTRLCILNCADGTRSVVEKTPFIIGSSSAADFRLDSPGAPPVLATVHLLTDGFEISLHTSVEDGLIDGVAGSPRFTVKGEEEHTLVTAGQVLAFKGVIDSPSWLEWPPELTWHLFDSQARRWSPPLSSVEVAHRIQELTVEQLDEGVIIPAGLSEVGFFIRDIAGLFVIPDRGPEALAEEDLLQPMSMEGINIEYGEFTCPVCWFKFDRGDVMNVAVHASLRGDSLLGEEHMQRFHATRFNDRAQALDALGVPAPDLACPHCRRKLPPGFLESAHHIFSIVGAPSSGKSYYLSVLVKTLQSALFQNFGITFRDADPSENVILTQMKTQLFSAGSPEEAFLAKTELEGALYETLPRLGRKVRLPKPFVFKLSHDKSPDMDFSLVFYDNAGEHFEPTRNSADSPGAQHIAVASGIFFLFDPLHNTEFTQRLGGIDDPQVNQHRLDQQDVILAETEVRIKSVLGLHSRQKIATPLAVILGKSDTWQSLLEGQPLLPATERGLLLRDHVEKNSRRLRELMLGICPSIVANAEAISSNVAYFALSSLGSSPVEFTDRDGNRRIGPDPKLLKPQNVEVPTLWVLSQITPEMVPTESIQPHEA